jgi:hypothetical protein
MSITNSIIETLSQCSYPINLRDYITGVLLEITNFSKTAKFFKVVKNGENIIVIKYNILTTFKERQFDIPIIIYITTNFPYEAPEIYVEKTSDTAISPSNTEIDPHTNRIHTAGLRKWNINIRIHDIIVEITTSFNFNFPIYKVNNSNLHKAPTIYSDMGLHSGGYGNVSYQQHNQGSFNPNQCNTGQCSFSNINDMSTSNIGNLNQGYHNEGGHNKHGYNQGGMNNPVFSQINYPTNQTMYHTGYNNNQSMYNQGGYNTQSYGGNNNIWENHLHTNQHNNPSLDNKSQEEEIAKKKLIEELKPILESRIKDELKRLKQQEDKLKNFYSELVSQNEKYSKFLEKREEIYTTLRSLLEKIQIEIKQINCILANSRDRVIDHQNCFSFFSIIDKDVKIIQILAIEATIDDIQAVLRKAFEKNIFNFNETAKLIRLFTREAFKIKIYREKILYS